MEQQGNTGPLLMPTFYEFFAGGGMAREGLGRGWSCLFANDFSDMKANAYRRNWGDSHLTVADVGSLRADDVPGFADLAWASFPCQDLSLAGNYAGIGQKHDNAPTRSGTFWAFWTLMLQLRSQGRPPSIIVLENVFGILTSNDGRDFAAVGSCLAGGGYQFGALLIDAARFVPHSRPRIFIVAVRHDLELPAGLVVRGPQPGWHPPALVRAVERMSDKAREAWLWWQLPQPEGPVCRLESIIQDEPIDVCWHTPAETRRLISMMTDRNLQKLDALRKRGERAVGTIYRRTRGGVQRAELRDDGIAGCLRTPAGGSSRQLLLVAEGKKTRTRLMSAREAARLMGLPDTYVLPAAYNDAYHVMGDGVAVPVVAHLSRSILEPIVELNASANPFAVAAE